MKNQIALVLLAMSPPLLAADLVSVYRDAVAYDAPFAAARAELEAGREIVPQSRSALFPIIGAGLNTTWNDNDAISRTTGTKVPAAYNINGWSASLTQPLFRWQNWVTYGQAQLSVVLAEARFVQARQELLVRVAQAYFDVLLAQDAVATAQAQKTAIAEQLDSAKRNFEVGTATITDTHEAQARFDLTVAQELATQNDLMVKRHALRVLTGNEPGGLKALKADVQLGRPQPDDMVKWVENAEAGSAGVAQAQAGYEIAQREIAKQRAAHFPTLDLNATVGRTNNVTAASPPTTDRDSKSIGLELKVPIFAGGYVVSKEREAVLKKDKALAELDNARRTAAQAARTAYLGVTSGLAQVKAYEAALASSQSALESNKLGYDVGVRINIDVLNAQSQLYDTRQKLAKARLDTLGALLKLKYAAGSLAETDLEAINALLE